ncbi:MAG: Manganese transport system rane protein MntB [Planctomycetota bacterium]
MSAPDAGPWMATLDALSAWTLPVDGWIVAIGILASAACAVPGTMLAVRRESMLGDALSHAVLPGIAAAFLLSGTRNAAWMGIGALAAGAALGIGVDVLHRRLRVERGTALGVAYTVLFALGLVVMVRAADTVDLDPSCVLFGALELAPLDDVMVAGWRVPSAVPTLAVTVLLNVVLAATFWRSMVASSADPSYAAASAARPGIAAAVVWTMSAATAVACFQSVGSIMVVALLAVPAATARLLTDRLAVMVPMAFVVGAVGAVLGHVLATAGPAALGLGTLGIRECSTAGAIGVSLGALFVGAALLAPERGALVRLVRRVRHGFSVAREDAIGLAWRDEEDGAGPSAVSALAARVSRASGAARPVAWLAVRRAVAHGELAIDREGRAGLTAQGRARARDLVRSHRLWEAFLQTALGLPADHVHPTAMRLEHLTDDPMRSRLRTAGAEHGHRDPHGRPIPPAQD